LARADAFAGLGLDRRGAFWAIKGIGTRSATRFDSLPLFAHAALRALPGDNRPPAEAGNEPAVTLPPMPLGEQVIEDYASLRLSLKAHPLALLREELSRRGIVPAAELRRTANGAEVAVAGLVLVRQQPGTASGVIFATLEDETGWANLIVWPRVFARFRRPVLQARLLMARGTLQRQGEVLHLIARRLADMTPLLRRLAPPPLAAPMPVRVIPDARNFR
jgi:error-prone DNA polymerase